jgi:hypothetical protein
MARTAAFPTAVITLIAAVFAWADAGAAEPFHRIRIGDADGFGFTDTRPLKRPVMGVGPGPADVNGNGVLEPGEFIPDLNGDGRAWVYGGDNWDNRSDDERADRNHRCQGCLAIGPETRGSIWTDLTLSESSDAKPWPDADGPAIPNNATFTFDFTVAKDAVFPGSRIFFNFVFADTEVDPAVLCVSFAHAPPRELNVLNQRDFDRDGWIQAKTAYLNFDEVLTPTEDGKAWRGWVRVVLDAAWDPYTAIDYVELSLFAAVSRLDPRRPSAPFHGAGR